MGLTFFPSFLMAEQKRGRSTDGIVYKAIVGGPNGMCLAFIYTGWTALYAGKSYCARPIDGALLSQYIQYAQREDKEPLRVLFTSTDDRE